jgi:hypothetical protein
MKNTLPYPGRYEFPHSCKGSHNGFWNRKEAEESLKQYRAEERATVQPCECGSRDASWHGDRYGLREYYCPKCYNQKTRNWKP